MGWAVVDWLVGWVGGWMGGWLGKVGRVSSMALCTVHPTSVCTCLELLHDASTHAALLRLWQMGVV